MKGADISVSTVQEATLLDPGSCFTVSRALSVHSLMIPRGLSGHYSGVVERLDRYGKYTNDSVTNP